MKQRLRLSVHQGLRTVVPPQPPSLRSHRRRMAVRPLGRHFLKNSFSLAGHAMTKRPIIRIHSHRHPADRLIELKIEWM